MEFNFHFINFFEMPPFFQKVSSLNESDWLTHKARLENINNYVKTKSIVIKGNKWIDCHPDYLTSKEKLFENNIIDLHNFFVRLYKRGSLTNLIIVKLLKNSTIPSHKNNNLDTNTKRFIIPIITNPEVHFEVGGERKSLFANEIWEINNSNEYRVENYSNIDCLHTIVDWRLED